MIKRLTTQKQRDELKKKKESSELLKRLIQVLIDKGILTEEDME